MKDNSFTEYIVYDILGHIEGLTSRRMFGGAGIYVDGKIVAIIVSGELYFKANEELVAKYTALGCHPFTYEKNGKTVSMKYMSATEEMLENRAVMEERVYESLELNK
jgi:DNA transformation protein